MIKNTILVLYSKGKFDQAAYAIQEYAKEFLFDTNVVLVEESRYANFYSYQISQELYKFTIRNCGWLNRFISILQDKIVFKIKKNRQDKSEQKKNDNQDKKEDKEVSSNFIKKFRKVDNIILRFNPNIIICTTPKSHEKALAAKERLNLKTPVYALITDYYLNKAFIRYNTSGYLVQNKAISQAMLTMGIPEEHIFEMGTPIRKEVMLVKDRKQTMASLGIENEDLPNIVLIGGRYSNAILKDAFTVLSSYTNSINLIVLTDHSETNLKYIKNYYKVNKTIKNVYCIDEVDNMADIYSIADVIVCTPTSSITYEACAREIPCVLLKDTNSAEKANLSYLLSRGYALRGETKDQIIASVINLLNDPNYYNSYSTRLKENFPSNSVEKLVSFIYNRMLIEPQEGEEFQQLSMNLNTDNNEDKKDD